MRLRKAVKEDSEAILRLRNQSHVRRNSFRNEIIDETTHRVWFTASLRNPCREIYVATEKGKIIGLVRADFIVTVIGTKMKIAAELSYFLNLKHCGKGYGTRMVKAAEKMARLDDNRFIQYQARTLPKNKASNHLLGKLGYHMSEWDNGSILWVKEAKI